MAGPRPRPKLLTASQIVCRFPALCLKDILGARLTPGTSPTCHRRTSHLRPCNTRRVSGRLCGKTHAYHYTPALHVPCLRVRGCREQHTPRPCTRGLLKQKMDTPTLGTGEGSRHFKCEFDNPLSRDRLVSPGSADRPRAFAVPPGKNQAWPQKKDGELVSGGASCEKSLWTQAKHIFTGTSPVFKTLTHLTSQHGWVKVGADTQTCLPL